MQTASTQAHDIIFGAGRFVLVTLNSPREKFWGALLAITAAGVSVRGVDLNSYEEVARQLRSREAVAPTNVFFPMHRVERVELDDASGELPSLAERFRSLSGKDPGSFFGVDL
jgi:hypothetical protein